MLRRVLLLAGIVMHTSDLGAQATSTVVGRVVRAGASAGVPGAEVTLAPPASRVVTDANGEFRFDAVAAGRYTVHVRRLGFHPESLGVDVPLASSADLTIALRETAQPLDTVAVTGRDELLARGKLAGFYERKKFGIGRFLEAPDLERLINRQLADVLASRLPGVQKIRLRGRPGVFIATSRLIPRALAGGAPQPCFADTYLDGVVVYTDGADMPPFDVNSINPAHISAIEFYGGPAQLPAQYNRTGSACGALLIWTK